MQPTVLLYGANGYTAKLIIEEARKQELPLVLAGRNMAAIRALSDQYALPYRIGTLDNPSSLDELLVDITVVIHAAGPFAITGEPMIRACIRNRVHYLDITGEIGVFEMAKSLHAEALDAGIMVLPGCGFDVVPTDCMAAWLHSKMPDATHFELDFATTGGGVSHGTATSMVSKLGEGGAIRLNGVITQRPLGHSGKWVDFDGKKIFVMSIPWGDVSTAYHTTGIRNIITYAGMPPVAYRLLKGQFLFNWLLRTSMLRKFLQKQIDKRAPGPDAETRARSNSLVVAEVRNAKGQFIKGFLKGPDGYTMTAAASVLIAGKVIGGEWKPGYQTPAGCYGDALVLAIPGVSRKILFNSISPEAV